MTTGNSTIDISTITNHNNYGSGNLQAMNATKNQSLELPKLKDVWRWVKSLVSAYFQLLNSKNSPLDFNGGSPIKPGSSQTLKLSDILNCGVDDVERVALDLARYKDETERIIFILKSNFRLPQNCPTGELEMHLIQKLQGIYTKPFYA